MRKTPDDGRDRDGISVFMEPIYYYELSLL